MVKYKARAIGVTDSENGKKLICFRMACGASIQVECDPNQAELVIPREQEDKATPC